jgi:hypothetical protein
VKRYFTIMHKEQKYPFSFSLLAYFWRGHFNNGSYWCVHRKNERGYLRRVWHRILEDTHEIVLIENLWKLVRVIRSNFFDRCLPDTSLIWFSVPTV